MKCVLNILKAFLINFCFIGIIFANASCPSISPKMAKDSPSHQVEAIIDDVICSFIDLHSANNSTFSNSLNLTKKKIIPYIDLEYATELALGDYWKQLDLRGRKIFERDVKKSLIQDYTPYLVNYPGWEKINISVNQNFTQDGNFAKVKLLISFENDNSTSTVTLKLIRSDSWKIFDLDFQSISLLDIFLLGYDSQIKRNGLENLLQIMLKRT